MHPTVEARNDCTYFRFSSLSPEVQTYFANLPQELDQIEHARNALEIGVSVLSRLAVSKDLDYVDKRINEFLHSVKQNFTDHYEHGSEAFAENLAQTVDSYFGKNGDVLNLIEDKLRTDLEGKTPLGQVYTGLKAEISSLRDLLMRLEGQHEAEEHTTAKAYPFEKRVFSRLQEIAKPYADIVDDMSLKAEAISGSKKGDYVYTLAMSDKSIVLDAKNYARLRSLKLMLDYLRDAMKERGSKIGIIVVPERVNLQKQIGDWNFYDGNKIITSFEHLEISIKFSKFAIMLQTSSSNEVNVGSIQSKLESIQRKMKEISTVKSKLTKLSNGVATSIGEIQTLLDTIRDDVNEKLSDIENEFMAG